MKMPIRLKLPVLLMFVIASSSFATAQSTNDGVKLFEAKKYKDALACFEAVVGKNKKDAEAWSYLAAIHLRREFRDIDKAEDEIDEAIDLQENVSRYHLIRGQVLGVKAQLSGMLKAAIVAPKVKSAFLRAVELDPKSVEARQGLFSYYLMAPGVMGGSEEESLTQAKEISILDPYQGHMVLASYYQKMKDPAKVENEFLQAIALDPQKSVAYNRLGNYYRDQKRWDDALRQFRKITEIDPQNPSGLTGQGDVYAGKENYKEATEKYLAALAVDKTYSPAIYVLALSYEKQGLKQRAKETYQWFLTIEQKGSRAETAEKKIKELN
ncbi:MAG: tetratricopeptide repeat protein [Ignavibacteriales bacterium]|nr:tetratricopeptide repeat protein [Ignavibacteriales bacterium]